jgi:hypothetical protein
LEITVGNITEQNKDELALLAISKFIGEECLFCGRAYKTLADLKDTIWVGYDENRRLACSRCWEKSNQNA